jgi:hypothetical protein
MEQSHFALMRVYGLGNTKTIINYDELVNDALNRIKKGGLLMEVELVKYANQFYMVCSGSQCDFTTWSEIKKFPQDIQQLCMRHMIDLQYILGLSKSATQFITEVQKLCEDSLLITKVITGYMKYTVESHNLKEQMRQMHQCLV